MTDFSISADFGCFDRMRMRVGRDRVSKHYPRKGTETISISANTYVLACVL